MKFRVRNLRRLDGGGLGEVYLGERDDTGVEAVAAKRGLAVS